METIQKVIFFPFDVKDLLATTILLQKEFEDHMEKVGLKIQPSEILKSENGGLFIILENGFKKAEIHLDWTQGETSILILFYSQEKFVKDSPLIKNPEELSSHFPTIVNFFKLK